MKAIIYYAYIFLLILVLTILTQIGGIVLLLTLGVARQWKKEFIGKTLLVFLVLYMLFTFCIVPYVAPLFGREKVEHTDTIKPTMYLTGILNRNYVRPQLNTVLQNAAKELNPKGIEIRYLDANFPFIDKFPLLPHLSHSDGRKIDISLIYKNQEGEITNKKKSNSGYGVFEEPIIGEFNQINKCKASGYFQYDYPKYLTLGSKNKSLEYSNIGTKRLIQAILKNSTIEKVFIEPHLKARLQMNDNRIRYHGCRAVRHDDHIHIQIR